ncbi:MULTISPECIES: hypothetical protein [Clostridium]|uniref:Uncharacterized protein n=1 Tax=Clostridium saccharoperbutylacetonicum N1-4(HMT) TaxID=931276 RepID=M1MQL4_9CLOT|nr:MULTISPECIES: hypothetical protein [Clostridium]AGF58478.1 hypothetical protein Cspa_c47250 [Clostridium saccharoperbutylacetonicum N1-4(HMT)]AQR97173.1 hypothetical protein CLSAP_44970 [Clostridium saccharoperbutylacetonicum]NRT60744.1 hypothetical protein [Clostridium saccharoperbutylacetonicum]NSB24058.1 hypothetical protein [Clostridium saccharoperbutylacetonicum]NSB33054.1 hypothetical protein [Clostridium saccharoperbutylacetonicum]
MTKERTPYNPTPGDYDTEKLTDLHSSETNPSSYARNIKQNSENKSSLSDSTERIPTLSKYSNMNSDNDEIEKKGEI